MVQAKGCLGGVSTHASDLAISICLTDSADLAGSSPAGVQAASTTSIKEKTVADLIKNLYKIPTPGHAYPNGSDHDQAEHCSCRRHIFGPAR